VAVTITETEVVWIAALLGGTGQLREAPTLPLDYDQVVHVVAAGVDAEGDVVRGMEDLEVDTLPERLRALSDDGRARLLRVVERTLTVDANTGIRDAQTLAVTMTSDERVALAAQRAGQFARLFEKDDVVASAGDWHLVARWRSNQREQDLAALRIAVEAAQAPSVIEAVGGEDALDALDTLLEVAELYAWGCRIDAELRRLGLATPPPLPAAEAP
jgi:hypothetical protein